MVVVVAPPVVVVRGTLAGHVGLVVVSAAEDEGAEGRQPQEQHDAHDGPDRALLLLGRLGGFQLRRPGSFPVLALTFTFRIRHGAEV